MRNVCRYHFRHRKSYAHDNQKFAIKSRQSRSKSLPIRFNKKNILLKYVETIKRDRIYFVIDSNFNLNFNIVYTNIGNVFQVK